MNQDTRILLERVLKWFRHDSGYYAHRVIGASQMRTDQAYKNAEDLERDIWTALGEKNTCSCCGSPQ